MNPRWMKTLWDAVEEAILSGITPTTFLKELRICWREALRQKAKYDDKILEGKDET